MILYLLPSERKQSSMDLVKEDFFEALPRLSFPFLNTYRREIAEFFGVKRTPLLPLWRRYKGPFWDSLEFWCLPPEVQKKLEERGMVISPLLGFAKPYDLAPKYSFSFSDKVGKRSLASYWRPVLRSLFPEAVREFPIIMSFVSKEEEALLGIPEDKILVRFEYYKKGKKVLNSRAHRAYTLRYILEKGVEKIEDLGRINFYDYTVKEIIRDKNLIKVILEGEGNYI